MGPRTALVSMAVSPHLAELDQALRSQVTATKPVHVLNGAHHSKAFLDGRGHFPPSAARRDTLS